MSGNSTVSLTLQIKGQAEAVNAVKQIGKEQLDVAKRVMATVKEQTDLFKQQQAVIKTNDDARKLGIRTEQQIRQEINDTRAAYERMGQSGVASANDVARSYQALTSNIAKLNRELEVTGNKSTQVSKSWRQMAAGGLNRASGLATGAFVAAEIVKAPLDRARDYDKAIAYDSLTATEKTGWSVQQKIAYQKTLKGDILDATTSGGGTLEGGEEAAKYLLRSGMYSVSGKDRNGNNNEASFKKALDMTMKYAFVSNSDPMDIANLNTSFRQLGISDPKSIETANDMAFKAGTVGRFHLQDLSRELPNIIPDAKGVGKHGLKGLGDILTVAELAMNTAATPGEAATNTRDMFSLFPSRHFAIAAGNYITPEKGDPIARIGIRGHRMGFDVGKYYENMEAKGYDEDIASFMLIDRQLKKNKDYAGLSVKLSSLAKMPQTDASVEKQTETANAMQQIVMHSVWGKFFTNTQSRMAFAALSQGLTDGEYGEKRNAIMGAAGAGNEAKQILDQSEFAKAQQTENQWQNAQNNLYDKVAQSLGGLETTATALMQKHQGLATAAYATTLAITALGGAALVANGVGLMGRGGAAATAAEGAVAGAEGGAIAGAEGAAVGGAGSLLRGGGKIMKMGRVLGSAGAVAEAGIVGWDTGTAIRDGYMQTQTGMSFDDKVGSALAHIAAFFDSDAQHAVEMQNKYDAMIELQQNQLDVLKGLSAARTPPPPNQNPGDASRGHTFQTMSNTVTLQQRRGHRPGA